MLELLTVPIIVAAVESLKMAGLPSKYASIAAVIIGAILGYFVGSTVEGMVIGLGASGLYSGVKAVLK